MSAQTCFYSRSLIGWAVAAFLSVATSTAGAAVLYQQAPADHGNGYYANANLPQQLADDFTFGGNVSLERITWWGGYDGNVDNGDDDFLVRLYSNISGAGAVLQEFGSAPFTRTATSLLDGAANDVYQYEFALPAALGLSSGAHYLFVQNLGTSDWFWLQGSSGNGNLWFRSDDTADWVSSPAGDLAFRLDGATAQIPEPGSLLLMLMAGFAMMVGRATRRSLSGAPAIRRVI